VDSRIDFGKIVLANGLYDTVGKPTHEHYAIILTEHAVVPIKAVVISSNTRLSKFIQHIKQWENRKGGHRVTGLKMRCVAVCDWIVELKESQILEYTGTIEPYQDDFSAILKCIEAHQKQIKAP